MYMCVLSLYTLYMRGILRHGGRGKGERLSTAEKRKKVSGFLTPFMSKHRLQSLVSKTTA